VKAIIEGSDGTWGDVPMTPHPTLSASTARAMAVDIMGL